MTSEYYAGLPTFVFIRCSACAKRRPKDYSATVLTKWPVGDDLTDEQKLLADHVIHDMLHKVWEMPRAERRELECSIARVEQDEPRTDLMQHPAALDARHECCWSAHVLSTPARRAKCGFTEAIQWQRGAFGDHGDHGIVRH
jgi:hypothetical protein